MPVTVRTYPTSLPTVQDIDPVAVPHSAAEDPVAEDVFLEYALFNATVGNNAVVTLTDKQEIPVEIFRVDVTDRAPVQVPFDGRRCPGGITWQASAAGVIGYLRWRK